MSGGEESRPTKKSGVTFSFSAGGWLQMYMFGVVSCLQDSGLLEDGSTRFVGASAGALAACCAAGDLNMDEVRDFTVACGEHLRSSWWHMFVMDSYVEVAIDKFASDIMSRDQQTGTTEVQDRLADCLEVYCTVLPKFQQKVFTDFTCKEDLSEALLASVCLAPLVGFPFRLRSTGELCIDGGIAAFQPKASRPNVITVSPFYWASADMRPSQFIPVWYAVRPPSKEKHIRLFDLGYNDAMEFLIRKQLVPLDDKTHQHHMQRRPDPKAPRRNYALLLDLTFLLLSYIVLRPLAIVVVYCEMLVISIFSFLRMCISSNDRGAALMAWLHSLYTLYSPTVFFDLIVGSALPSSDDSRIAGKSAMYRFLAPIAFGKEISGSDRAQSHKQRKRFNVAMPVFQATPLQKKFDEFPNLGWSHSASVFDSKVVGDGKVIPPPSAPAAAASSSAAASVKNVPSTSSSSLPSPTGSNKSSKKGTASKSVPTKPHVPSSRSVPSAAAESSLSSTTRTTTTTITSHHHASDEEEEESEETRVTEEFKID